MSTTRPGAFLFRSACASPDGATGRRGQYLVEPGRSLDCHADTRTVKYTVYRQNGEGRLVKTEGKVQLR